MIDRILFATLLIALFATSCATTEPLTEEELLARAAAIHERVLTVDTHVDIAGERYATPEVDPGIDNPNLRCDLVKMVKGQLDGVFLAVFVGQRGGLDEEGYRAVYDKTMARFEAIHRLPTMYPERCTLVTSARDLPLIASTGRRAILIGIENGYPIGEDLARLREFHALGARYITLCHTDHNQICDSSSPDEAMHGGLSEFGKRVVAEMNHLGIMVDVSHISEQSFWDVIEVTKAPLIASHSGCSGVHDHDRNLTDEQLRALAENGGTIQIVGLGSYLRPESAEYSEAVAALREELQLPSRAEARKLSEQEREELQPLYTQYWTRRGELREQFPGPSVVDFVDHIEHAVGIAGIDHVGIGTDFDGGGGIRGFQNHAEAPNVTIELVRRGFGEEEIAKIWGGNLLRVWGEVEKTAERLQGE
jgi:membrane dipeptidase